VVTGIPSASAPPAPVAAAGLLRQVVLQNLAIVGSVNANRTYFEAGLADLARFRTLWGEAITSVITERLDWTDGVAALSDREAGAMKSVLVVARS